ncbi:MAG: PBP1A family penicillin-binding protein [Candidatus Aminicenantes bacterium]|nr:PBP1A family penicillin-binding protein [Candidatus Aminicenantes bacterium]
MPPEEIPDKKKKPLLRIRLKKPDSGKLLRTLGLLALIGVVAVLGAGFGAYLAVRQNLPSVSELETFESNIITTVYSDEGQPIKDFAIERRVEVTYDMIPDVLKKAIIATEDARFYNHRGVDLLGILRAIKENIRSGRLLRRPQGGSTITQQLARLLFLYPQQTVGRKLKEMYLSLQIEKLYSKEKILEMYCNQFYLNHGVYGVETASNFYFGKSVTDLTLEEAALIAGIFRGPSFYSPYTNVDVTLRRRNHVINRMVEEGHITKVQGEEAKAKPIEVLPWRRGSSDFAAYFFEEVRKYIERKYGSEVLYRGGLKVYTTLNPMLQEYAEEELLRRLREMDKQKGWRRDKRNLLQEGKEHLEDEWLDSWLTSYVEENEVADAIVLSVSPKEATVKVKRLTGRVMNKDIGWTKTSNLEKLIQVGDVIQVKVKKIDPEAKHLEAILDQHPLIEGAFLAIDPRSGQIKAMVGGYSFRRSEWNRATQAQRQAGSAIKPILYAAALDNRFTPATIIVDEPVEFPDKWLGENWAPRNYDRKYKGAVTVRIGLEESRNVVTAKILDYISPQTGVDYCRRFGLTSTIYPYLSLSLGTFEVSVLEMVSAYTVFPNKGVRIRPYFISRIEDREGTLLEEARVEAEEVISPQTAYLVTSMMEGVILRGTGNAAGDLGIPLGGKTGTTSDYSDAWFIGFSPSLCAGVWIGNDTRITLGARQSGAVAALPAWKGFFKRLIDDETERAKGEGREPFFEDFEVPVNINFVEIDRKTGLLATPICLWPIREAFLAGTEPPRYCSHQDHLLILDYYGTEKATEEHD